MSGPMFDKIVRTGYCRWFVRRGARTYSDRGFRSREKADAWIQLHALDWRVGYVFRIAGDTVDTEIVDRKGQRA